MKGVVVLVVLAVVVALVGQTGVLVRAHSWVACADYRMTNEKDSYYYNDDACFGYPRNFKEFDRGFGVDAGYDYSIPASGEVVNACPQRAPRTNPVTASYTDKYPMARYTPGQQVCLAWPTKNHVAAPCTNQYIPDGGVKIFLSPANPTADPTQTQFEKNLLAEMPRHENGAMDFKGYQNCSKFCENMDKSLCIGCFDLPTTVAPGLYTMQWYWIFNPGQAYTTCMDVQIGAGGGGGGPAPPPPPPPPASSASPSASVSLSQDTFILTKWPTVFQPDEPFKVGMRYNAGGDRMAIVDILSIPDYSWYGKGVVQIKGTGEVEILVTPQNNPPSYKNFVLKAWIVAKSDYDADPAEAFTFELTRIDVPAAVGTQVVYSEDGSIVEPDDEGKGHPGWALAVLFFSGMIAAMILAGVAFWYISRRSAAKASASGSSDYRILNVQ